MGCVTTVVWESLLASIDVVIFAKIHFFVLWTAIVHLERELDWCHHDGVILGQTLPCVTLLLWKNYDPHSIARRQILGDL